MKPLEESLVVVTGLPHAPERLMLMQMLAAGGMHLVSDGLRAADEVIRAAISNLSE